MIIDKLNSNRNDDQLDFFGTLSSSRKNNLASVILNCPDKESSLTDTCMPTVHLDVSSHKHTRHTLTCLRWSHWLNNKLCSGTVWPSWLPDLQITTMETPLIKASKLEELQGNLDKVCELYHDDLDRELLQFQLLTSEINFQNCGGITSTNSKFWSEATHSVTFPFDTDLFFSSQIWLLRLILLIPATIIQLPRGCSLLSATLRATCRRQWLKNS